MRNVPFILSSEVYVDEQKEWISKELGQCREPAVNGWFLDSRPRRKAVKFEVVLHQKKNTRGSDSNSEGTQNPPTLFMRAHWTPPCHKRRKRYMLGVKRARRAITVMG
ncbi:putative transmembrane protein [Toxoplasma gondii VAND]|uniref:Putative transmembrane protein n=1 Tax=Toxoplasma gondii VAND TaxID=933077 RepID=A0A086PJW9_TOXGO|nr:putative transmembrane protein [Toxoplasma gondii VAND]